MRCGDEAGVFALRWQLHVSPHKSTVSQEFGFHLAVMDLRQNSRVHEAVVSELLAVADVASDYVSMVSFPLAIPFLHAQNRIMWQTTLSEAARVDLLTRELSNVRPLASAHAAYSERTRSELAVLRAAADIHRRFGPSALPNYIISNCGSFSDLLEVAVLLKEAGLLIPSVKAPASESTTSTLHVNIIPLFETIDDLRRGASIMEQAFQHPLYRGWLMAASIGTGRRDRPLTQEIMLGYSDSSSA